MHRPKAHAAALVLVLAACAPQPKAAHDPPDPPVAHVGGETLHLSDVARAAHARDPSTIGKTLDPASDIYKASLQAAVDQRLLALEAQRLHLDRDPKVKRRLAAARDKVLGDAALDHEIEAQVGEKALRALYDEELKQARPQYELHLVQIVMPTESEALAIKAQLAAGADFATLAQNRSTDMATRYSGGDFGWLAPSALPGAFGAAMATAQVGDVVGPLRHAGGFAILKVEARRDLPPPTFDQARPQLVRFLAYDRLQTLLKRLRAGTEVAILKAQTEHPR